MIRRPTAPAYPVKVDADGVYLGPKDRIEASYPFGYSIV